MKKFKDAFNGLANAFRHRAVMTQAILGVMAIIGGVIIRLDYHEWLAFIICIFLVIAMEVMNTSIERLSDIVSDEYSEKIKVVKDLSAAAVLIASLGALVVCVAAVIRRI